MGVIKQTLTNDDVKVDSKTVLHEGFCPVVKYEIAHKQFDGDWSEVFDREVVAKPAAVAVLPYDSRSKQVVLIEQFRIGALGQGSTPWLIEIVAGIVDKQETAEELVRRELFEEACLEMEAIMPIYDYFSTPGGSTERIQLFCAKVDASKAGEVCGIKDEHEDIKVHVVSVQDAFAMVRSGQINNAFTIIALQWLELNLAAVEQQWC